MAKLPTLATCTCHTLEAVRKRGLHPSRERSAMIFAAGALNNRALLDGLGSAELSTFYDGMVAAGHLDRNPYWADRAPRGRVKTKSVSALKGVVVAAHAECKGAKP